MAWIRIIGASLTLLVDRCLASVPSAKSTSRTVAAGVQAGLRGHRGHRILRLEATDQGHEGVGAVGAGRLGAPHPGPGGPDNAAVPRAA
jgi:hypothetical protein